MFLSRDTGELMFSDGFRLFAGMSGKELGERETDAFTSAGTHCVGGVPFSVECRIADGALRAVTLRPLVGSADRRRAALLRALSIADLSPDSRALICVDAPFGEITVASEPYFNRAEARLEYSRAGE